MELFRIFGIRNKFCFVSYNEIEWVNIQKYLFTKGFKWETERKNTILIFPEHEYPRLIQNWRTNDKYGMKYLIISSPWMNSQFTEVSKFFRKEKLKKLNGKSNRNLISRWNS